MAQLLVPEVSASSLPRFEPGGAMRTSRIDMTWVPPPPDAVSLVHLREPSYGARVETRIGRAPTEPGFVAERGFVGFQMESGARITVRRGGGKPMLYYRARF